jgi:hypothetical protein
MIISRKSARAKPMAEGSPQYSVYRSLQGEPTVNARLMDPSCKFLYVEFTISELRDMLKDRRERQRRQGMGSRAGRCQYPDHGQGP